MREAGSEEGGCDEGAEDGVHHDEGGQLRGYRHQNPHEGAHLEYGPDKHHHDIDAVLREGGNVFSDALIRVINLCFFVCSSSKRGGGGG